MMDEIDGSVQLMKSIVGQNDFTQISLEASILVISIISDDEISFPGFHATYHMESTLSGNTCLCHLGKC